ncbi:ABATE domain-containing protein [Sphingomonas sp. 7/4-4]|uniref:CGNR zinc finger domain-containing protein n=1 Tax=Sphingomonas sp. 7/4-4 TaxID=3018446 RepID=UPI0022F3DB63|nr:ABATE domain-containing protein [Sphingomonas sp. 7/4-4]WBY07047.1 ABATE domain-containing protein [Sphingomonas sp. 7/4-4]
MPDPSPSAEQRDGFRFRGGHRALDLVATLAARLKPAPRDLFATPGDVERWLRAAGFDSGAPATEADLLTARRLREAIHDLAVARIAGKPDPAEARADLNAVAAGLAAAPQLDPAGTLAWHGNAAGLLGEVAREAVLLFGGTQARHIRQCEAEGCAILFLDTSRSHDRRWCSMAACGNKAKVAEFRRRKRSAE